MISTAWNSRITNSLRVRPTSIAVRFSGVTSIRSIEPPISSMSMEYPAIIGPDRHIMIRMPGTNHCHGEPPSPRLPVPASIGPNRNRKSSGCPMVNTRARGSRTTGANSRENTVRVSRMK